MPSGAHGLYPLPDPYLELHRLAQLWLPAHPGLGQTELFDMLLAEFWQGHLRATLPGDSRDFDTDRSNLLDALAQCDEHPGIVFTSDPASSIAAEELLPNGDVNIFIGSVVQWPINGNETVVGEARTRAYQALASIKFKAYADLFKPVLYGLGIERQVFRDYLLSRDKKLPEFWFGQGEVSKRPAQADVRRWLIRRFEEVDEQVTRPMLLQQAKDRFVGLSENLFDQVWREVAPAERRQAGRKPRRRPS